MNIHRLFLIFLATAQLVVSAGWPLVMCKGADGHARVEFAYGNCDDEAVAEDAIRKDQKSIAIGSPSCTDTPIFLSELATRKTFDQRIAFQWLIVFKPVGFLRVEPNRHASIATDEVIFSACTDITLHALRTVILTV